MEHTDTATEGTTDRTVFSATEARALGVLIEKEFCTPDYYPLTLNSLVTGCNQRSNRDPVMHLGEREIIVALDSLKDHGLVWSVAQAGSRVPKYRHSFTDRYPVCPVELAVLCELILRGPQTVAGLRTHAGRMIELSTEQVEGAIRQLETHTMGALVGIAPRRPGQRGERYAHTLCGHVEEVEPALEEIAEPARQELIAEHSRLEVLEERVAAIEDRLDEIAQRFEQFARQFE